ncbi:MAG TPA: antibiotic biosynthesis monooxygenase [Prolixibacteraceae bacterium]|nr:antibiotic biosynthesis monooxygenase [Prolixibacteraceae bacterium]
MASTRRDFLKFSTGTAVLAALVPASSTLLSFKQTSKTMSEKTLNVVAIAETSADRAEELKSVCLGLIEPTRKEEGCISYDLYQDTTIPGRFTFIENWKSKEHLDVHLKSPHLVAAGAAFGKIVTKEMVVMMLNKLT